MRSTFLYYNNLAQRRRRGQQKTESSLDKVLRLII